jgi:hypothetical protein
MRRSGVSSPSPEALSEDTAGTADTPVSVSLAGVSPGKLIARVLDVPAG